MTETDFVVRGALVDSPPLDEHLGEFYFNILQQHGDQVAQISLIDGVEKSRTYSELLHLGKVVSCILKEYGLKSGDTVMIACGNVLDFAPVYLGAMFSAVACSPVYPLSGTDDFKHSISIIKPGLVFCDSESHRSMLEAISQSDLLPSIMSLDVLARRLQHSTPESVLHFQMAHIADVHDHVALVLTSSGTTGRPKGVEHSHATVLYVAKGATFKKMPSEAVGMTISAPFWVSGLIMQILFMVAGAKIVLLRKFQEEAYLGAVQKHKVNFATICADQMTALAKWPRTEDYDSSSLMYLGVVGARVSPVIHALVEKRLKKSITSGYGMTKSWGVFGSAAGVIGKPGTVGKVLNNSVAKVIVIAELVKKLGPVSGYLLKHIYPGHSIEALKLGRQIGLMIVSVETGKNLGPNSEGELCFKSPVMLKGYRGNPEATKELFDAEGFLMSGDVAYYDDDECFYIVDRIKGLIKYKNMQVHAVDIEEVLVQHEGVKEAAVVGIQNEMDTEHATAFVVRQTNSCVSGKELLTLVEGKLPKFKWLYGGVVFSEALPKTGSGKVHKRQLKAMHAETRQKETQ